MYCYSSKKTKIQLLIEGIMSNLLQNEKFLFIQQKDAGAFV